MGTMHTHLPRPIARALRTMLALTVAAASGTAGAQLRLPTINLPQPVRVEPLDTVALRARGERLLARDVLNGAVDLAVLRATQVAQLLRTQSGALEADPRGEPVVRREILAWSPSAAGMAVAIDAGLTVLRERKLEGLDETVITLRVPDHADTAAMLERLRARDPDGSYDFNHIYTGGGFGAALQQARGDAPLARAATPRGTAVGLVDNGVDGAHAVFRNAAIERWGCDDVAHPAPHGTAVAALMVGQSERFRGVAPDASLYAADVYCGSATGGSAERIAAALAWFARQQVGVVNLSLVGPPNRTLERVVDLMVTRGHLLVAAVGNDGPAAPPLYPASYPGVVGVSAVDARGRALPEAARGPQVMFAAPGSKMVSAAPGTPPYQQVRGTSFASPIVAALLAQQLAHPGRDGAKSALAALARKAEGGREGVVTNDMGHGVVGASFRIDPSRFRREN